MHYALQPYKQISLKKERISRELTVSNNSLRVERDQCCYIVDSQGLYEQLLMYNYRSGIVVALLDREGTDV